MLPLKLIRDFNKYRPRFFITFSQKQRNINHTTKKTDSKEYIFLDQKGNNTILISCGQKGNKKCFTILQSVECHESYNIYIYIYT